MWGPNSHREGAVPSRLESGAPSTRAYGNRGGVSRLDCKIGRLTLLSFRATRVMSNRPANAGHPQHIVSIHLLTHQRAFQICSHKANNMGDPKRPRGRLSWDATLGGMRDYAAQVRQCCKLCDA